MIESSLFFVFHAIPCPASRPTVTVFVARRRKVRRWAKTSTYRYIDWALFVEGCPRQGITREGSAMSQGELRSGLEGVLVAETVMSHVDGAIGELVIRGYGVEELGQRASFEGLCALLWEGAPLGEGDEGRLRAELGAARVEAAALVERLGAAWALPDAMEALRAAVGALPSRGSWAEDRARVTAAVAVFAAAWWRRQQGRAALAPDPGAGHVEDLVRLLTGAPDAARARALETYLATVSDHGLNASTFAARVVISTGSELVSAVVAALGALKGPLHGGAPGPVLDMLDAIGAPEAARPWLEAELAAGRRIMGMGHRVYRVRDPRAAALEAALGRLEDTLGPVGRLPLARAVEREATALLAARHPDRALRANVEFATAILLEAVGLPRALFTAAFAAGRVVGWCAHAREQAQTGRLIRPASRYVGPRPPPGLPPGPPPP
jgi:citrate synthase